MITRRSFFARLAAAVAGIALAPQVLAEAATVWPTAVGTTFTYRGVPIVADIYAPAVVDNFFLSPPVLAYWHRHTRWEPNTTHNFLDPE